MSGRALSAGSIASIGVFSALAYVGSFVLLAVPNATLSILLVFVAGYFLGFINGSIVGLLSALLISIFNPYGLAMFPILVSQVLGYTITGALGGVFRNRFTNTYHWSHFLGLALLGILTALIYQIPVSVADAWLFGPFWPRLVASGPFALVTVISNVLFFVLLFPVLAKLKKVAIFSHN